ncbi:replication factor C large subunit [Candidatus Pacearchaeota archaeon]|nr:replication factor C large subunit [Candidatus Pacearchaeota archaeon]
MTNNSISWSEKYRPKNFDEILGQNLAIETIRSFVNQWGRSKNKALILHGPPGTGKTTLAHVTAHETNSEIFELNASDLRNKAKLQEVLKPALEQQSLTKAKKIILIDEVDGISAVDRGGATELLSLMTMCPHPIIITANDIWIKKLSGLRKKCDLIMLKELDYKIVKDLMIQTLNKEGKFIDNDILTKIAIKAKGDLRAALNDLQAAVSTDNPKDIDFSERNKETSIFEALKLIFKTKPNNETLRSFDSVNMQLDEIILWMEENIPSEYYGEELAKAYHALSNTDLFKGRIYRKQYWRFMVYENIFLTYGISAAKKEIKQSYSNYKKPERILKIWINNLRVAKKKTICTKYASLVHIGQKRAMSEFPMIKNIIKSSEQIQKELKLSEEEIEYVMR